MANNPFTGVLKGTSARPSRPYRSRFADLSLGTPAAPPPAPKAPPTPPKLPNINPAKPVFNNDIGNGVKVDWSKLVTKQALPTLPNTQQPILNNDIQFKGGQPKIDWSKVVAPPDKSNFQIAKDVAAKAGNLLFSNTKKVVQSANVLTGGLDRQLNQINQDEQSKKITSKEADARRQQILNSTNWAGFTTNTGTNVKKAAGVSLGSTAEVAPLPIGKALKGASFGEKLAKGATTGAIVGGAGSAGSQLTDTGTINPKQLAASTIFGAGLGSLSPAVERLVKGKPEITPLKGRSVAASVNDNRIVADIQNAGGRPETQKLLEDAHNSGDFAKVKSIVDSLHPNDPYKAPMQQLFAEDISKAGQLPSTNAGAKTRGFVNTIQESPKTTEPVKTGVGGTYTPLTNKETLAKADAAIAQDFEGAVHNAKTSTDYSTHTQAQSLRLIDQLQQQGRTQDAIDVVEATAKRATAAGQSTQILAAYNRLTPEGILQTAQRGIDKAKAQNPDKYGNLRLDPEQAKVLRNKAEQVQSMPEGEPKMQATRDLIDEINRVSPTPFTRKVTTIWKAGLLTGIKGAVAGNTVGNATNQLLTKLSDVPAAGIDRALSLFTGQRSRLFTLKGLASGFGEGTKIGYTNFKKGVGSENLATKYDINKVYFSRSPLGRAAQRYTDNIFNFYAAADRPFFHAALKNSLNEEALLLAKNQGLRGSAARAEASKLVKNPPDDMLKKAVDNAEAAVFQDKNALGSAFARAKQATRGNPIAETVGEVVFPFTGVPSSIATAVSKYSPTGAVTGIYKALQAAATGNFDQAAQRRLSTALGKSITGTGMLWLGGKLFETGQLTLGYPSDQATQERWQQDGKQPYSILIGGKWRSLNYLGPTQALIAIGGEYANSKMGGGTPLSAAGAAASGGASAIVSGSPLRGLQNTLEAITNPSERGATYFNNLAGSVVPTLVKDIGNATDNVVRKPTNPAQAIESRLPYFRANTPAALGSNNAPASRTVGPITSLFDPFKSSQATNTPEQNIATDEFYRRLKMANSEQRKVNQTVSDLVQQGEIYKATRKAQEWNDSVAARFQSLKDKYEGTPSYDPAWNDAIDKLQISDKPASIKARKKKEKP